MKKYLLFNFISILSLSLFAQNTDTTNTKVDSLNQITPVFSGSLSDLDGDNGGTNQSGLLQSSRDVFASTAGFSFSAARFRIRGYMADQTALLVNGIPMNDRHSGWGIWYKWGGLNDVTRYAETKNWLTDNPYHFGGFGGYSNINTRASHISKGNKVSYSLTNRSYRHRFMFTKGTGKMENGWNLAGSFSVRYSNEGYVPGVSYQSFSYYLAAEKELSDKHSFNISAMGANTYRGKQNIAVEETFGLTGTNYYNSNWGYQTMPNGDRKVRNARMAIQHAPVVVFTDDIKFNDKTKLSSSLFATFGTNSQTSLNWNDAQDPRPDYYRYLPSYQLLFNDSAAYNQVYNNWVNDQTGNTQQVNWDGLYAANDNNLFLVQDADGIAGNDVYGKRAKYILENRRNDEITYGVSSNFSKTFGAASLSSGLMVRSQSNHFYKTVNDLLGADFWMDYNRFTRGLGVGDEVKYNNTDLPDHVVRTGEKFGYDYYINNLYSTLFGQVKVKKKKYLTYLALEASNTSFFRNGVNQNGIFPDNSKGKSATSSFLNYAVKGGFTYKVTGNQFLSINLGQRTQAPTSKNAFVAQRTRNTVVDNLQNEEIQTADINYEVRMSKLKLRLSFYHTKRNNSMWTRWFYHDEFENFVNFVMTDVDYLNQGLEFGVEGDVWKGLKASAVVAWGQHLYASRPTANVYVDNSAEQLSTDETVYIENFKMGGMPQSAASIGLKYKAKHGWFMGLDYTFVQDIYLDPNPVRRTESAVQTFTTADPQWNQALQPTEVNADDHVFMMNVFVTKGKRLKGGRFGRVSLNVSNFTNNTNFNSGGFEQLRYDPSALNKFPPKVGYMYGLTYFLTAQMQF